MANVLTRIETVSNAGATVATFGANNYKHAISTSDAGRTLIVKIAKTNMTDAELGAYIAYINTSHGASGAGDSAFTVAGVGTATGVAFESGVTDVVFLRCQGTGDLTVATVEALTGTPTVTIEAIFTPAK
jgi:hypothetical protein